MLPASLMLGDAGSGGEGGDVTLGDCQTDAVRCTDKTPEVCDTSGHWVPNTAAASGDCAVQCEAGKCVECLSTDPPRCAACGEGEQDCSDNQPQKCVDGEWSNDGLACRGYCDAEGTCATPPSCGGAFEALTTCGLESCCTSLLIPGGSFLRDYDGSVDYGNTDYAATISPFFLDKYEVTVGRMRRFVEAYDAIKLQLRNGDGKAAHIADDTGWSTALPLPADKAALLQTFSDCEGATWSNNAASNNDLPINCVAFSVAYAFCISDGGRLPTEAEWNFAGAGGDNQRAYPWGPSATITDGHANYGNANPSPIAVGSKPLGNARWGQADMAGNVSEWALDYYSQPYPANCNDCLNTMVGTDRTERGGSFISISDFLYVSIPSYADSTEATSYRGFRCARDLNKGE